MTSQFGALLRQQRLRAGLTQEALADRSGLGVRTVRALETGERADPRVATVRQLTDALNLDAADRLALLAAAGHVDGAAPEPPPADDRLADAAYELAHAVRARWQREEEQRRVHDPYPLPVRWRAARTELTDSWANIRRAQAGTAPEALDLTGRLDQIVQVYRRIPSGRLVVLGRAGSGKTILTLRFVLDLLPTRTATDPVPVIFGLGTWNPTTTDLRDWLAAQLVRDHPGLSAPGPNGSTLAAALVEAGRVLPVLDGFDELADGLHRAALEALNGTALPMLLTSRVAEYAGAVAGTDVLTAAGGVELTDLTLTDLADYLPRTTRKAGRGGTVWEPVLTSLRERPDSALAEVLATPLMVGLARTVYSDTPDHDAAELLDTDRFPTAAAIEEHLLGDFVPAVYRARPQVDADRAGHWLGYLAHHLNRLGTHDLAWWQLGVRGPANTLVLAFVAALVIAGVDIAVEGALLGFGGPTFMVGAALGLVFGTALAVAQRIMTRSHGATVEPARVRLRIRRGTGQTRRRVVTRVQIGFVVGLLVGVSLGFLRELVRALRPGFTAKPALVLVDAAVFGLVLGLAAALVLGLMAMYETPLAVRSASDPAELLRANRTAVAVQLAVFVPTFAVIVAFALWVVAELGRLLPPEHLFGVRFSWNATFGTAVGLIGGLGGGLAYALCMTAWGRWVVFARVWLPLTGRLPWALMAFLEDAYRRGVLRRAGAVYQFRHARLQDHLANRFTA
ncbi:helix-turn-helix domain-containing protein [Actinophytocola sediminis]